MKKILISLTVAVSAVISGIAMAQQEISTVAELERLAPLGGEYRLAAGHYELSKPLELEKGLVLIAAGKELTTIVGSSQYNVISIESSDKFVLKGISFEYAGLGGSDVVDIKDADFEIIDCSFSGGIYSEENDLFYGSGLYIYGDAKGSIKDSYFSNNQQDAIHLETSATVSMTNSLIENNVGAIALFESTSLIVSESIITDNGNEDSTAIYAEADAVLTIKDSLIDKNGFGSVWILDTAVFNLEGSIVRSSGEDTTAIIIENNASSNLVDNGFFENAAGALWLLAGSSSTVSKNKFSNNGSEGTSTITVEGDSVLELNENIFSSGWGIWFAGNARVKATKNEIIGSLSERFAAVTISDTAQVELNKNMISLSNNWAVFATDESQVVLLQNSFEENTEGAFLNKSTAPARFVANKISNSRGFGTYLIAESSTYVAANNFTGNRSGLVVGENATATIVENNFIDNSISGLGILADASSMAISNRFSGNATNGIVVGDNASAVLERNQLNNNPLRGILVAERSFAKITENSIKGSKVAIFITPEAGAEIADNIFENNEIDTFKGVLPTE